MKQRRVRKKNQHVILPKKYEAEVDIAADQKEIDWPKGEL